MLNRTEKEEEHDDDDDDGKEKEEKYNTNNNFELPKCVKVIKYSNVLGPKDMFAKQQQHFSPFSPFSNGIHLATA